MIRSVLHLYKAKLMGSIFSNGVKYTVLLFEHYMAIKQHGLCHLQICVSF